MLMIHVRTITIRGRFFVGPGNGRTSYYIRVAFLHDLMTPDYQHTVGRWCVVSSTFLGGFLTAWSGRHFVGGTYERAGVWEYNGWKRSHTNAYV